MNTQQLLNRIDKAWKELGETYAGLPESKLTGPGVVGDWSIKDVLAHVTTWEEETLKVLPLILEGKHLPRYSVEYGGIDAFNALMAEKKHALSLEEVLRQMDDTHRRLVEFVQDAPDEHIRQETVFRRRLRLDTYSHYPEHTRAIEEWRQKQSR
jgi:hypothetical protein